MSKTRNNNAVVLALIALLLPVVLGYAAYVTDLSKAYTVQTRIKDAVDFSALAGISQLESSSSLSTAKNAALNYLNSNLSQTLPGFMTLSLSSSDLQIQGGVYDFSTRAFTYDELSSSINAIKVSYTYTVETNFATWFMLNNITSTSRATAAKQYAGSMPPGTGFPLVIKAPDFCSDVSGNTITFDNGMTGNTWWTAFDQMGGTSSVLDILWWWQLNMTDGTQPQGLTVGDEFFKHLGADNNVWVNIDPVSLTGGTYIFPVGTDVGGNMIRVDGFVGGTINNINPTAQTITITLIPGYINNLYGGTRVSSGTNDGAICAGGEQFLAYGYTLVQ